MRAVVISRPGGPEVLEIRDVPVPVPEPFEVLVRVRATALNRADLLQREGRYPPPAGAPANIPGLEFAGEVADAGPAARRWHAGDRVFGITGGGAHAEYVTIHEDTLAEVPSVLDWNEAGGVPEVFITAHDAMVTQAGARSGERVLVHAVGSGVGLAAVQLARAIGAIPFGTARTADKVERARRIGLEDGVAVDAPAAIGDAVKRWTGGTGMDVILDLVGGDYLEASIRAAALRGRIMLIGTMGGQSTSVSLGVILRNRLTIRGTVLRARAIEEKIAVTAAFDRDVVPLLAGGRVRPITDSIFPLEEIRAAHERLASNATFGKVVLSVA
jgi:NADPH2:quinone reductase